MKFLRIIGIITAIIAVIIISITIFMNKGQNEVASTEINDINLSNVEDGKYTGSFDGYRWSNTVEVTVASKKITSITFVTGQTFRIKEIEDTLISNVIDKQSTKVDTISGATLSSKAILKAIENAFNK